MRIEKVNSTPVNILKKNNNDEKSPFNKEFTVKNYNPVSYRDYNINFTARLFRTPANFYAQPFNRNGMPVTMKEYLFEDYEDRQNMPPAQMLKVVYSDINNVKSLDEVKEIYKDEPLFENLTDNPNRKSRTGVLAEIDLMKDENKSLFKDGSDNLGIYLLRKIYQEGKTLKEINTDFLNDISPEYKGLSQIEYNTLSAYGIKYPNLSFWKSLTATREEFPYEYKPRKVNSSRIKSNSSVSSDTKIASSVQPQIREKKKFGNIKDWEINKLSDALIKGNGSRKETEKLIKKQNIKDNDTLNFVAKYMGEINSIVLEKLHISEDMREYFENYEDITKNQREKFESYMKNPQINERRSKVMSSTIRLFFDLYGADGNNEDFKELLDYAHNIKPERIKKQKEHDLLQEEYERELGIFEDTKVAGQETIKPETPAKPDYNKLLDEIKKDYNVKTYDFDTPNGKVTIVSNLQEAIIENFEYNTRMLPQAFAKTFISFVKDNPKVTEPYILTTLLNAKGIKLPEDDRLMPLEDAEEVTLSIFQEFSDKYPNINRAAKQAMTDVFLQLGGSTLTPALLRLGVFEFPDLFEALDEKSKKVILASSKFINEKYNEYKRPLSDYEVHRALNVICSLLKKYDSTNSIIDENSPFADVKDILSRLSKVLSQTPESFYKNYFVKEMSRYLYKYGGSIRFLFDKKAPERLKIAKVEEFICNHVYDEGAQSQNSLNMI